MTTTTKPSVHIHESNANPAHLSEICAGLEEEGIPYAIFKADGSSVKLLALEAANHSRLRVGIGITAGSAMLQLRNCPIDVPASGSSAEQNSSAAFSTGPILGQVEKDSYAKHETALPQVNAQHRSPILHINLCNPAANTQCRALGTNAARAVKGGVFI